MNPPPLPSFLRGVFCCLLSVVFASARLSAAPADPAEPHPPAAPFFFIQLSDPQFGMFNDNADFVRETANFERMVTILNRLHPAFVVVTGDLVNRAGDAAQIAEYHRLLKTIDPTIPVHNVAGNHDIGNTPTAASIAAYTNQFGPDHYTFRHGDFLGVVLNSTLIQAPQRAGDLASEQERWLRAELDRARTAPTPPRHLVIFQHHPWFLIAADEADQYFNIPRRARAAHLAWFREAGVHYLFCGHYHRNALAREGGLEVVTTGPVGKPLGVDKSGFRLVIVRADRLEHHYYALEDAPARVDLHEEDAPGTARRGSSVGQPPAPAL